MRSPKWIGILLMGALGAGMCASAQEHAASGAPDTGKLPTQWEELTGPDFIQAIQKAQGVCLLPFGILEKHGPQLPIGTDLINARWVALHSAAEEYAVVFPAYYFGQIDEARHQPGTVAYSRHIQLDLLQETTDEMGRNGCRKILIVNGHGGNLSLLPYFAQTELQEKHDYVVYVYWWDNRKGPDRPKQQTTMDMHAGESETSHTLVTRPDLVHMDRAGEESGADQARLHLPADVYTGIWWYARFPNHYSGDGTKATPALGEYDMKAWVADLVSAIRAVKADDESLRLQNEFYEKAEHPLDTKQ
ncbi:MAG TPA: creatininase family protein [Acidobacteriaceae bacterium]|jgi:creatinine amidohydrolase|nr:creatininase family protein [Acidobacteriaceae bacterium]